MVVPSRPLSVRSGRWPVPAEDHQRISPGAVALLAEEIREFARSGEHLASTSGHHVHGEDALGESLRAENLNVIEFRRDPKDEGIEKSHLGGADGGFPA